MTEQTHMPAQAESAAETGRGYRPEDGVVELTRELIRIDTSNYGDAEGPGEREAAEYVAGVLSDAGLEPQLVESQPRRTTLVARWEGTDPAADPLLIHGHLDVVPAQAVDWKVHPFSGEVVEGCVWGRGAVDMKDFDAMVLSVVRARAAVGAAPRRPVVLAFTADEEAGSRKGAHWLVEHHPDLVADCTEAVGEVGGFSVTVRDGMRIYPIQTAEKGMAWMRLRAQGRAGHGSLLNDENAVTELTQAVARLGSYAWPVRHTPTLERFLAEVSEAVGVELAPGSGELEQNLARLGNLARMLGATVRNTTNPTMLDAGYKVNVIPGEATACVDGRFLPGFEDEFFATVDELIGETVSREMINHDAALETEFAGGVVEAMKASLAEHDPVGRAVPYLMSGGTDGKAWSRLGIRCFGFSPLRLPPDLDFIGMFHGVDERVPTDALEFGARVLDRFLDLA